MEYESRILEEALEAWTNHTKIQVDHMERFPDTIDAGVDAGIAFNYKDEFHQIYIIIKREFRPHQMQDLKHRRFRGHPIMLVAEVIPKKLREELRNENIPYLETSGNLFYREKGLYFCVDGNKPVKREDEKLGRAFTKTGLRLVYNFLLYPELVSATYRAIADETGVNFGNINFVMTDLKEQGFLVKIDNDKLKLVKRKELLDKWIDAYGQKLKPSLLIGTFRFFNNEDAILWKKIPLRSDKTWWGGEPAGNLFTNHLLPEVFTVYTTEAKNELVKNYRFIPHPGGEIKVYQKFWNRNEVSDNVVQPLLVYIDLILTGDRRCLETAEKIYNEHLQNKF